MDFLSKIFGWILSLFNLGGNDDVGSQSGGGNWFTNLFSGLGDGISNTYTKAKTWVSDKVSYGYNSATNWVSDKWHDLSGETKKRTEEGVAFFMSKGWTKEQASGIAANLKKESDFNTNARGDGGQAYGIGQWHPDRQAEFKRVYGHDIHGSTLQEQLAFVDYELTKGGEQKAGQKLKTATTAQEAGADVSKYYERPKDVNGEARSRANDAAKIYAMVNIKSEDIANINKPLNTPKGKSPAVAGLHENNGLPV